MFESLVARFRLLIWGQRVGRFALIGAFNTLFGFLAFPAIYYGLSPLHVHYMIVLVLSYIVSISVSYATNKTWVFRSQERGIMEFLRFASFYVIFFAINAVVLPIGVEVLKLNPVPMQVGMAITIAITSYAWHALVTFRQGGTRKPR